MVKREELLKINFDPKLDCLLDWHLWIQLAYSGKFYYVDEQLTRWRLHTKSYIKKSRYKSPFDLQIKAYLDVFKQTKDFKIILKILGLLPLWYARQVKKFLIS